MCFGEFTSEGGGGGLDVRVDGGSGGEIGGGIYIYGQSVFVSLVGYSLLYPPKFVM